MTADVHEFVPCNCSSVTALALHCAICGAPHEHRSHGR